MRSLSHYSYLYSSTAARLSERTNKSMYFPEPQTVNTCEKRKHATMKRRNSFVNFKQHIQTKVSDRGINNDTS